MANMYFAFRTVVLCLCVLFLFAVCSLPLVRTDYTPAPFLMVVCEVLSFETFQCQICRRSSLTNSIGHHGSSQAVSQLHSELLLCPLPQIWSHGLLEEDEAVYDSMLDQSPKKSFVLFECVLATSIVDHQLI